MNAPVLPVNFEAVTPAPTLADALAAIAAWPDLTRGRADQLACHVRKAMAIQAAAAPPGHGPARFTCEAFNATLWRKAPAVYGFKSKNAFSGMVSGCRTVLMRMHLHDAKVELAPAWQDLHDRLPTRERKVGLVGLMQFASRHGIAPNHMDAAALDRFELWCCTRQLKKDVLKLVRRSASGWNWARENIAGWPQISLIRRSMRVQFTMPLEHYPSTFQQDVEIFLANLAADPVERMLANGIFASKDTTITLRARGAKPRTIENRREQIRAAAAALVLTGTPIEAITSLRDLVWPIENPTRIFIFHRKRRREREAQSEFSTSPSQLIAICDVLRQIAKFHCRLDEGHVAQLASWKAGITPPTPGSMGEKNRVRLRALLEPRTYAMLLHLPQHLLGRAEDIWQTARERAREEAGAPDLQIPPPVPAARLVMFAAALEILLFCPLRRSNLLQLDANKDLLRPSPKALISQLVVSASKTKTSETIDWPVPEESARLIERWLRIYRPVVAQPGNTCLFPGQGMAARNEAEFGNALGELVEQEIGAEFNMHLARHFAVVRYLRAHPGQYAVVSRQLGHRKVETTRSFYAGLEVEAAAEHTNKLFTQERSKTKSVAKAAFKRPTRKLATPKKGGG